MSLKHGMFKLRDIIRTEFSLKFPLDHVSHPNGVPLIPLTNENLIVTAIYSEKVIETFEFLIAGKNPYVFTTCYYPLESYQGFNCRKIVFHNTPIFISSLVSWKLKYDVFKGNIFVTGILDKIYD